MFYCDAHTHLQKIENLPLYMKQAKDVGITQFICNATHEDDWVKVIEISQTYPGVSIALGVHPWFLETLKKGWERRLENILIKHPSFMIGEIGLDKVKAEQNPKMFCLKSQEDILQVQLELASQYKRPFHLHCVRAWDRILYILEKFRKKTIFISHSHYGNADIIPIMDQMGAYFSYSSVLFKRQKEKVQSCLQKTPIHKILVESDASASIEEIPLLIQKISSVRKEEKDFLVKCIQQNFNEFLNGRSI